MKEKILGVLCYLGFAPPIWLWRHKSQIGLPSLLHVQNGLFLYLFLLFGIVFFSLVQGWELVIQMQYPIRSDIYSTLMTMDLISILPFLGLGLFIAIGIKQVLRDSAFDIPFISNLEARKGVPHISIIFAFLLQLTTLLTVSITLRASYLARPHDIPASVYMLYQKTSYSPLSYTSLGTFIVPKWLFALGFYPISEAANARWGNNSVAIIPLTRENLNEALKYGSLVFVASHEGPIPGTIPLYAGPEDYYSPDDLKKLGGAGPNLQLLYIAACYGGSLGPEWKQYLGGAGVISFNRISWVTEHIQWLWLTGPKVVAGLK